MPTVLPRVTGSYLQPLLETAAARGVDARALAQAAGLATPLDPPPESLAARDYIALLATGAELAMDPHFGLHVGERMRLGAYSVYGLILLACADFAQALEQTQRYEQLAHDLGRSQLQVDGESGLACYTWTSHFPDATRHLAESVFAGIRTFGSWLAGRPLAPRRLAFAHHSDADPAEYERVLGMVPAFGANAHLACFDASLLAMPVPNADAGMYPVLQQHAERLLRERKDERERHGIVAQVRAAVIRNLANDRVRLASIAAELGLSSRTLQRKLADSGASFQQVLDAARYALAQDYLRQRGLSLADIAFLLGYQEQSAFTHAFREWSGLNPGAWRERALAGSA
ncbi:putative HTH-type transcriptional regulator Rv1395 [Massilia sp. Bi118]|uniref:AraC family transcriptional regulator n=1 Tax=Massilia sp. Bi118 TaxID=2822346 RepID=UPI001DD2D59B|nr:AraC family transcriptional regulator [Massilia sp. Bi118]CAH0314891.1 putative HTH-type transcriptional regulator Rv1395 [Massilia sp. Bi118]